MFGFIKNIFLTGLSFLSSLVSTTPLSCIWMNNQACKVKPEIIMLIEMILYFILLVLKQVNLVVAVSMCSWCCKKLKMLKYLIWYQELKKQDTRNGMKRVSVNVD